jgi:N-acyl-D-amino-acid deacylase
MKRSASAAFIRVTRLSRGRALCLIHGYSGDETDDRTLRRVLAHPLTLYMTDALIQEKGAANPGAYGTFPRLIQKMYREWGRLTLEETISRMTGRSALRFGLTRRGVLAAGNQADITLFDPENIRDNASVSDSRARPSGIRHVFLNGRRVVRDSLAIPGRLHGRVIRREGTAS